MAARAWCTAREAMRLGTKPECALESVTKQAWYTSLLRIRIDDRPAADRAGVLGAAAQVLDTGPGGAASLRSESTAARVGRPGFLTPRQRSWGAGLRKAGPDGIGAGARLGGNRQPRITVGLMNLAGGSRRPPERRTNRVGPLESTEDQGALRTVRLRMGGEGSPSSL